MSDPTYTITITVEQGGEMVRKVTMLASDYRFERPFTPNGVAAGLDFEAIVSSRRDSFQVSPLSDRFRMEVPSAHIFRSHENE